MSLMFYKGRAIYSPEKRPAGGRQQEGPNDKMTIDPRFKNRSSVDLAGDGRPPERIIEDVEDSMTDDPRDQAAGPPGQQAQ